MNKLRKTRFERLKRIEQNRLDRVVNELRKLNQLIERHLSMRHALHERLREMFASPDNEPLQIRTSRNESIDQLQRSLLQLDQRVQELKAEKQTLLEKCYHHRGKVKGWEIMLDKIKVEYQSEIARTEMAEADDRVLSKHRSH